MNYTTTGAALLLSVAALVFPAAASQAAKPAFNACVSEPSQSVGMYSFSTTEYSPTLIKRNIYASGGGIANDSYYYSHHYDVIAGLPVIEVSSYSLKDWSVDDHYSNRTLANVATDIAYFAPRDEAYACFSNESGTGYLFGKYRFGYFLPEKICDLEKALAALDFDSKGTLYAIDWSGDLFTVNTADGSLTKIGSTGVTTSKITGGAIDRSTDTFYYSVYNTDESAIYTVDLTTAKATKLYTLDNHEQVGGMYFPETYDGGTPAATSNPTLNFSGTSLSGTIRFRAPQRTVGGEPISGKVTYHVEANGVEIATGETSYADGYQSYNIAVDKNGRYCFSLYFSNDAGRGPRSKTTQYIGQDIPKAPESPRLSYSNGLMKVYWTAAPSTGVNGGPVGTRSYVVTRYPDGASFNVDSSPFSEQFVPAEERTTYYYTVATKAGELLSQPSSTPSFEMGTVVPPYAEQFPIQASAFCYNWLNQNVDLSDDYSTSNGLRLITMNAPEEGVFLTTPKISLRRGHKYDIAMKVRRGNANYVERLEITAGKELTAAGLTAKKITDEPFTIETPTSEWVDVAVTYQAEEDGDYYIALHGLDAGRMVYLKEFSISKGVVAGAPGAVTDLAAVADQDGAHKATLTFSLPTVDLEGKPLADAVTSVDISRDGTLVKTVTENLQPEMSVVDDTDPAVGEHTYTVVANNSVGTGVAADVKVFVGFNIPFDVEWVKAIEDPEKPGTVTITWAPADLDIDNKPLTNAKITYNVYNRQNELIKEGLTETTYTTVACSPDAPQDWAQYRIGAVSEAGEGALAKTVLVPVGVPYEVPYRESFENKDNPAHLIGTTSTSVGDRWSMVGGFEYDGKTVDPVDNDGGMMGLDAVLTDEWVGLYTGKIDLKNIASPALTFWLYHYISVNGRDNENRVKVSVCPAGEYDFTVLKEFQIKDLGERNAWHKATVDLSAYEGKVVRLRVDVLPQSSIYTHLDDMRVATSSACNLTASAIKAPASVCVDTPFDVSFTVTNSGDSDMTGITVSLERDGEVVGSKTIDKLSSGVSADVKFPTTLDNCSGESVTFAGRVEAAGDLIERDNVTDGALVWLRRNGVPVPGGLAGEQQGDAVVLTWAEPVLSEAAPEARTEDFESSTAWTSTVDGWKFLDLDEATIGGIGKKQLPVSGRQSFFLMDGTYPALNDANSGTRFHAFSGDLYLCSMYSMRGNQYVRSNDWAITPELYGGPQTVSLYASSFLADEGQTQYNETFEVLYSLTGTEPEDFILAERFEEIAPQWTRYDIFLPDGARYMAIRGVSFDRYLLMVDDVAFARAGAPARSLSLEGYDLWRDGKLLTNVTSAGFVDKDITPGETYRYRVAARYAGGELSATTPETVVVTAPTGGLAAIDGAAVTVSAANGVIAVKGGEGRQISVVMPDGRTVARRTGSETTRINVAAGAIYIVTVDSYVFKVKA